MEAVETELWKLAPRLVELVNLAIFDPELAARLVPDQLLQSAVVAAAEVAAEEPYTKLELEDARAWPVGPWPTSREMIASIEAVYPEAVGKLYRALGPRIASHCGTLQPPVSDCDGVFRRTVSRLSSPAVSARAAGNVAIPVTRTQRELGRLGSQVVAASHAKLAALEQAVWGNELGY